MIILILLNGHRKKAISKENESIISEEWQRYKIAISKQLKNESMITAGWCIKFRWQWVLELSPFGSGIDDSVFSNPKANDNRLCWLGERQWHWYERFKDNKLGKFINCILDCGSSAVHDIDYDLHNSLVPLSICCLYYVSVCQNFTSTPNHH